MTERAILAGYDAERLASTMPRRRRGLFMKTERSAEFAPPVASVARLTPREHQTALGNRNSR
jgi:hypothetical protein